MSIDEAIEKIRLPYWYKKIKPLFKPLAKMSKEEKEALKESI